MEFKVSSWERPLLARATQVRFPEPPETQIAKQDPSQLDRAYAYCEALTAAHSRSFHLASALLPPAKRRAARALYAFCRVTDDIVDQSRGEAAERLEAWRHQALRWDPPVEDRIALAWADARARFRVPESYAEQLIDGVARDLGQVRYATFEELAAYAYGVASTVGLMSMHIIGFSAPEAVPYAVKMGVALQLTNILRDVGEDWRAGRLYLPREEMIFFGIREEDLKRGDLSSRWRAFMRFQIDRNRRLYEEARPGIRLLDPDGRFAIGAAADLYAGILDAIEANDYDVFNKRAHISRWGKLSRLPGIWWRVRRA